MKKFFALITFILLSVMLVSIFTPKVFAYDWKDDFNYQSVDELKNAGWTVPNEQLISVGGGLVNLTATDQQSSMISYIFPGYSSPSGIENFSVEIKHYLLGTPGDRYCNFSILTENHKYSIACSEEPSIEYDFLVDDQLKMSVVQGATVEWHTLTFEKKGNALNLYFDGTLKGSYTGSDNTRDGLVGVQLDSNSSYDYVSVSQIQPAFPVQSLYIVAILVAAVGISTAIFLFSRKRRK